MLLSLIVPEHRLLLFCGIVFFLPMTECSSRLPSLEDLFLEILEADELFVLYSFLTNAKKESVFASCLHKIPSISDVKVLLKMNLYVI